MAEVIPEKSEIPENSENSETVPSIAEQLSCDAERQAPVTPPPKRGRGRPRKEPATVAAVAAPPEHSLRDVMARLEGVEKRLASQPPEESALGYLNARRAHNRALFASFMPR